MHWKLPEWHGLLVSGVADRVDLEGELIGVEGAAEEAAFGVPAMMTRQGLAAPCRTEAAQAGNGNATTTLRVALLRFALLAPARLLD
eukprot:1984460-Lingulodinium_polyedra.AAC.1